MGKLRDFFLFVVWSVPLMLFVAPFLFPYLAWDGQLTAFLRDYNDELHLRWDEEINAWRRLR